MPSRQVVYAVRRTYDGQTNGKNFNPMRLSVTSTAGCQRWLGSGSTPHLRLTYTVQKMPATHNLRLLSRTLLGATPLVAKQRQLELERGLEVSSTIGSGRRYSCYTELHQHIIHYRYLTVSNNIMSLLSSFMRSISFIISLSLVSIDQVHLSTCPKGAPEGDMLMCIAKVTISPTTV